MDVLNRLHETKEIVTFLEDTQLLVRRLDNSCTVTVFKEWFCGYVDRLLKLVKGWPQGKTDQLLDRLERGVASNSVLGCYQELGQYFCEAVAIFYLEQGRVERAFLFLNRAARINSSSTEIKVALGALACLLDVKDAKAYLTRAVDCSLDHFEEPDGEINLGTALKNAATTVRGKLKNKFLQRSERLLRQVDLPPEPKPRGLRSCPFAYSKSQIESTILKYSRPAEELVLREARTLRVLPSRAIRKGELAIFQATHLRLEFVTREHCYTVRVELEDLTLGQFLEKLKGITEIGQGNLNGRIRGCSFRRLPHKVIVSKFR
jgi:hypothetical protein